MQRAIDLSLEKMQQGCGGPFGAVIVKDGTIIAEGWNKVTSDNDPTAHAEVTAIRNACAALNSFDLSGCEIYTSCEPCPMCLGAIYWARLDKMYFGNTRKDAAAIGFDDDHIYTQMPLPITGQILPVEPLMRDAAQKAFKAWMDKTDKIEY